MQTPTVVGNLLRGDGRFSVCPPPRLARTLCASVSLKRAHSLHPSAAAATAPGELGRCAAFAGPRRTSDPRRALPANARRRAGAGFPMTQLKAFIVEDSPVIRENLVAALEEMAPIDVVGTAEDETRRAVVAGRLAEPLRSGGGRHLPEERLRPRRAEGGVDAARAAKLGRPQQLRDTPTCAASASSSAPTACSTSRTRSTR